jgi:flagellar basal body-associated protein FliL
VAGAVVMIVVLLVFPVLVILAGLGAAAILGTSLNVDAEERNKGSELLDLNT